MTLRFSLFSRRIAGCFARTMSCVSHFQESRIEAERLWNQALDLKKRLEEHVDDGRSDLRQTKCMAAAEASAKYQEAAHIAKHM